MLPHPLYQGSDKMILEDATYEAYDYYPRELSHGSGKPIIAVCTQCGKETVTSKDHYRCFCSSCSHTLGEVHKGKCLTEDHKEKIRESHKGTKNPNFGKQYTNKEKQKLSESHKGSHHSKDTKLKIGKAHKGEKAYNYKGGKRLAQKRTDAKRRKLGSTFLLPLNPGEVGHHVTDEYVIGIPSEVHRRFGGYERERHRALVLQWLKVNDYRKYNLVLEVL